MSVAKLLVLAALAFGAPGTEANEPKIRIASTGAIFIRDYSNPAMGEAYADPNGLTLSDVMKNTDGTWVHARTPSQARMVCASIGARLPTALEYASLANFLTTGNYYQCSGNSRQVRPFNPFQHNSSEDVIPKLSHSATWVESPDEDGVDFEGLEDYVGCLYVKRIWGFSGDTVRCVHERL